MSVAPERLLSLRVSLNALRRATRLYMLNHSPRAFLQASSFLVRKAAGRIPPINVVMAVTYRCQCQCPHCYASIEGRSVGRELSTVEFLSVLNQLKALGVLQVLFTGGEPLLRPDIFDLIAHARRIGLLTRLSTNGYLLDRACAARLKRAGLIHCGISIDEVDPSLHDRFRMLPGCHARALHAFAHLREYHIDRRMLVHTSHAKIAAGLECFVELAKSLKVNSCFFVIPYAIGRWDGAYQEVLSEGEMTSLRRLQKYRDVAIEFPTPETNCCAYDKTILNINPMGEVSLCPAAPFSLGNVCDKPLADIWQCHVSALRLESRGRCPLNDPLERERMRAHCASVLSRAFIDAS